jgi:outer membrane protein TolC
MTCFIVITRYNPLALLAFRAFLLLMVGGAYLSEPARGQAVDVLTPEESVRIGLDHNARLQAAQADAAEARAAYHQVRAGQLPSIQSQASYTRLSGNIPEAEFAIPGLDTTFTVLPVELNRFHSEVSIEQPLFTGFRLRNQIRAAAHEADAAGLLADQEAADVAFEIRRSYWHLYEAVAVHDATATALNRVEEHLRNVQNQVEVGAALTSDLLSAQTRRTEVLLEQVEAENGMLVAQLELNRLLGRALDAPVQTVAEIEVEPVSEELETLVARAIEARPHLLALEEQVRGLEARVDAARGAWLPEITLVGRYVYARPNPYVFTEQNEFRATWEAGSALRWSLWDGGRRRAETSATAARLDAAKARLTDAREQVAVEVSRQVLELNRATEAVQVALQHVREADETLRVTIRQHEEGMVLAAAVLEAEEAARMAQARRAQARADYAIARAAILNALGQVW